MATRIKLLLCISLIFSACASSQPGSLSSNEAQTTPPPSYLTATKGCALVIGGSVGSKFSDPQVSGVWDEANRKITEGLFGELITARYLMVKVLVAPGEQAEEIMPIAASRSKCNRVVQVSHHVNEDIKGRFFQFNIDVFRLRPDPARAVGAKGTYITTESEYRKEYRYPRTRAMLDEFSMSKFAALAYGDLLASGVLGSMQP